MFLPIRFTAAFALDGIFSDTVPANGKLDRRQRAKRAGMMSALADLD